MLSILRKSRLTQFLCSTAALTAMLVSPSYAGMFDVLDTLTKKVAEGTAAANQEVDAKFAEELRKEMPAYAFDVPAVEQSTQYVNAKDVDAIKDVKKVGIVNFSVEFLVEREATASGSNKENGKTRGIVPDTAKMQAIVDELYAKTVSDISAMGIEVVPFETIKATKNYAELASVLHPSPWLTDTNGDVEGANGGANSGAKSVFVAPTGLGIFMDNPKRVNESVSSGMGAMFGTNIPLKLVKMGYELNREVELLSVNMVVDFSVMKSSGRSLLNVAKVKSADIHHLQAENTYLKFLSTRGNAPFLALKKPVVSDKPLFSEAKNFKAGDVEDTATGTSISVSADGNEFDAGTYYARSGEMLEATREMFIAELKKAK